MNKPIVHFRDGPEYRTLHNTETGQQVEVAIVYGVPDHPRLGYQRMIHTSEVLTKCEDGLSFETRNTVYKKINTDDTQ